MPGGAEGGGREGLRALPAQRQHQPRAVVLLEHSGPAAGGERQHGRLRGRVLGRGRGER